MAQPQSQTVRLSLRWLLVAALLVFGLGVVGGIVGQQLVGPRLTLPRENQGQIISTVQQVTVSPNKNRTQVVEGAKRSLVLISRQQGNTRVFVGTGVIVTNDGLIATTAEVAGEDIRIVDEQGQTTSVAVLGSDPLYGITYLKLPLGVAVPIELSNTPDVTGSDFLGMTRNPRTLGIQTYLAHGETYELPDEKLDGRWMGRQRMLAVSEPNEAFLPGAAMLDEEGKLVGLHADSEDSHVLTALDLKISLDRMVAGKRELNPLADIGIDAAYRFVEAPANEIVAAIVPQPVSVEPVRQFAAVVIAVRPRSLAAQAGLKAGDAITKVGQANVAWQTPFVAQLGQPLPVELTVWRQGSERMITLQAVAPL